MLLLLPVGEARTYEELQKRKQYIKIISKKYNVKNEVYFLMRLC